ncbi:hypothetical protein R4Q14_15385, partial [Brachyspira intermedia]
MKIAVQLFGHLRTFKQCSLSIKKYLLDVYNCDVFIHTWDELEHSTKTWRNTSPTSNITDKDIEYMLNIYNPKKYLIEHQINKNDEILSSFLIPPYRSIDIHSMKFMFYSMESVNNLRRVYSIKNNIKYDWIIVTRPDIMFYNTIQINDIIYQANILGLDLNKYRFFAYDITDNNSNIKLLISRVSDILFMGKEEVIDKYCSISKLLNKDFIQNHMLNIVSVYAAAEIKLGIIPTPISYVYKRDWENIIYSNIDNNILYNNNEKNNKRIIINNILNLIAWWIPIKKWRNNF